MKKKKKNFKDSKSLNIFLQKGKFYCLLKMVTFNMFSVKAGKRGHASQRDDISPKWGHLVTLNLR